MRGSFTNLIRSVVCGLMILGASVAVFAQFKAGLQGTITDTTGGLVAGATVTLTNTETNKSTNTVSSDEGFYRFNGLAPGKYSVTVTQANFKKKVVENINVTGEIVQGLDVAIEAGGVNETVTITDEQPPLRTEDANIDKTLTTREIQSLPQVGRDPYELARLTPGIFGDGARSGNGGAVNLPNTAGPGGSNNSIFQTENQVPISANGQRISANSYQIDGVSVDSQTWGGAAVVTPSQESVKEVKVSSSTYSAQDGRNSGAVVKVISQNGTNIYHGSAFLKYDEPGLNAFNKYSAPTRINDKSRQYGGSLGGRLIRDKLFFFFTYEGYKTSSNNTVDNWIETSQYRQVVSAARPGSIVAKFFADPGIAPRVVQTLSRNCADFGLSAANCHEVAGGLDLGSPLGTRGQYITDFSPGIGGGFDGSPDVQFARLAVPTAFHGNQYNPRIDWNATEKDSVAFTAFFTPTKNQGSDAAGRSRPMEDISSTRFNWATSVIYRRSISATLFNEARVNFTHWGYNEVDSNPDVNFGLPRIEIEGYSIDRIRFGADRSESTPGVFSESTFHIGDTLTWTKGTHVFNFGIDIGRDKNANSIIGGSRPLYTFEGLWSFANDTPLFEAVNLDPTTGAPAGGKRDYRSGDYSFFVQDDWKLRPNLTVNLGLRYELFTPLKDKSNQQSNLILGPNGLVDSKVVVVDNLFKTDKNNFGPQVGFAWSPKFLKEKAVLRGGFGIGYNRIENAIFLNSRANPPFLARFNICCGTTGSPFVGGQILYAVGSSNAPDSYPSNPVLGAGIDPTTGAPRAGSVEIYGTPQDQQNAQILRYSLELQYEMPYKVTATIGYQGSDTRHLIRLVNQNFIFTQTNPAFFAVYFPTPDVKANYNAMNVSFSRRYANGFVAQLNYRWSKSLDNLSNEGPGAFTNQSYPLDNALERGPSDFDVKHYLNFYGSWDLPIFRKDNHWAGRILGGWQVSSIVTYRTGLPWTPLVDTSLRSASGAFFGPIRPTVYFGGAQDSTSNDTFLTTGNFSNNLIVGADCNNAVGGCSRYFLTTVRRDSTGTPTYQLNPPGIGRNSFRGPNYADMDLTISKKFKLPMKYLGESTGMEIRANFFNVFNTLNLASFGYASDNTIINRSTFGKATAALAGRVVEFQARFNF